MACSGVPTIINTLGGPICIMTSPENCIGESISKINEILNSDGDIGFVQNGHPVDLSTKWSQLYSQPIMAYVKSRKVVIGAVTKTHLLTLKVDLNKRICDYLDEIKKFLGFSSSQKLKFIHCGRVIEDTELWNELNLTVRNKLLVFVMPSRQRESDIIKDFTNSDNTIEIPHRDFCDCLGE